MSTQREQSLDNFLSVVHELRGQMESLFPAYLAGLHRLCQMPDEFEHRFWTSQVEALLQKVKADYENYQLEAQKANLFGKMAETMINITLLATRQQPMPHPIPLRTCISISASGRIEPALLDDSYRQPGAVFLIIDKFETIARRLEDEIMTGKVLPRSEEQIPKLMYDLALKHT